MRPDPLDGDDLLQSQETQGGRPTRDAFGFARQTIRGATLAAKFPDAPRYVVLITDGVPTWAQNCSGDFPNPISQSEYDALVNDVATAHTGDLPNDTFVIGLPGSEDRQGASYAARSMLSAMAEAGGTTVDRTVAAGCTHDGPDYCHFDLTQESDLAAALYDALGSIVERVASELDRTFPEPDVLAPIDGCSFPLPDPPPGFILPLDFTGVFYPAGGTTGVQIPESPSPQPCDQGWTVDDPQDPTELILCSETCAQIRSDPQARVEIEIECFKAE